MNKYDKREQKLYDSEKVTIYLREEFFGSVNKTEAKLHETYISKYAQYDDAQFLRFTPYKKRSVRNHVVENFRPFCVIVKGWNHASAEDIWKEISKDENATVCTTKYKPYSSNFITDFIKNVFPKFKSEDIILKNFGDFGNE